MRATRALIHLSHFAHNCGIIRSMAGTRRICLAVKANAYGHGLPEMARFALTQGITDLGTATADEAIKLKEAGITAPVILFGIPQPDEIPALVEAGVELFCTDTDLLALIARCPRPKTGIRVHIKVDTGMGRIGCQPGEALSLARHIRAEHIEIAGLCTHFPVADEPDRTFTGNQISALLDIAGKLGNAGIDPGLLHAANSAGILGYEDGRMDMVRPGIMAYGYPPARTGFEDAGLKPVMELVTTVGFVKELPADAGVSYGLRFKTANPRWIGTLPIGYADGLPRTLSGRLSFYNKRLNRGFQQVGTICMDQCMVDLGPSRSKSGALLPCPVKRWEDLVIFGPDSSTAADLAAMEGTISYEILCGIGSRVPRIYLES